MGLLERILFWISILILLIAVIGERSKISTLAEEAEKAKTMNVIYQGEDEGEDEEDTDEDTEENDEEDESNEGDEDSDESEEDNGNEDTEENNGGEE